MKKKTTVEILKEARGLLSTPEQWSQRVMAKNKYGKRVSFRSPDATSFCTEGAIARCSPTLNSRSAAFEIFGQITRKVWRIWFISTWNDVSQREHAHVLDAFDQAIELAENET